MTTVLPTEGMDMLDPTRDLLHQDRGRTMRQIAETDMVDRLPSPPSDPSAIAGERRDEDLSDLLSELRVLLPGV